MSNAAAYAAAGPLGGGRNNAERLRRPFLLRLRGKQGRQPISRPRSIALPIGAGRIAKSSSLPIGSARFFPNAAPPGACAPAELVPGGTP